MDGKKPKTKLATGAHINFMASVQELKEAVDNWSNPHSSLNRAVEFQEEQRTRRNDIFRNLREQLADLSK